MALDNSDIGVLLHSIGKSINDRNPPKCTGCKTADGTKESPLDPLRWPAILSRDAWFCPTCYDRISKGGPIMFQHISDPYEDKLPLRWDDNPQKRRKHKILMGVIGATQIASMIGMGIEHFPSRIFVIDFVGFLIVCAAVTAATLLTRAIPMNPVTGPFTGGYRDVPNQVAPSTRLQWRMDAWAWKLLGFGLLAPFGETAIRLSEDHQFDLHHTMKLCLLTWGVLFPLVILGCLRKTPRA